VKRHWKLLTALVLLLLVLGAGGVWVVIRDPEPVRAYERIKLGMTLEEVELTIGMPASNYGSGPWSGVMPLYENSVAASRLLTMETGLPLGIDRPSLAYADWTWDDYWIKVAFENGRVIGYYLLQEHQASFLNRMRQFLGL
jgi:hypothetical protein